LLREDSVLLSEVFDDGVLFSADPARQGGNEDLPGLEDLCHRVSLRKLRDAGKLQIPRKDAYNRRCALVDRVCGPYDIGTSYPLYWGVWCQYTQDEVPNGG
jgi:hypothetical protein